ncbi:MAG: thiamine pyrophosphate-dependent dehydrogenase E1 component subunit alpha [Gammaproteobacteria bacterium]|nr:thiamine pyrophosphate-dependent dehydrogenase E1 component subunit alpha [Gammaproteobacteria bacterium]
MGQALSVEDLLDSYRTMKTIREFEDRVHIEFTKGGIPGFVHLYAGEEASAAGIGMQLRDDDRVASNHRGHGHCIAKGVEVKGMMAEIYGKKTGICHGKGGSMHIADLDTGMMGANGIVGGGPPLACGAALAAKMKGTDGLAVVFAGDGASNQGTTFEALNLASVWKLPVVFVFENNGYAEATASKYSVSCENISERAVGFGMPGKTIDGHDFFAVHEAFAEAAERARAGNGPSLIEHKLDRFYGHFEGDNQSYRPKDEVKKLRENSCCIKRFSAKVTAENGITPDQLSAIDDEVAQLIEAAVTFAESSPEPDSSDLLTDVYIKY